MDPSGFEPENTLQAIFELDGMNQSSWEVVDRIGSDSDGTFFQSSYIEVGANSCGKVTVETGAPIYYVDGDSARNPEGRAVKSFDQQIGAPVDFSMALEVYTESNDGSINVHKFDCSSERADGQFNYGFEDFGKSGSFEYQLQKGEQLIGAKASVELAVDGVQIPLDEVGHIAKSIKELQKNED